jgi:CTP synthase (UTP-ammonia lyase)
MQAIRVALVGDHDESILAHQAIPLALQLAGARDAEHAETHPDALLPLITLFCALVEASGTIHLEQDTMIARIYGRDTVKEGYHYSYGLNPGISGRDGEGEARALELAGRGFYILTQFQPERSALKGALPPVVLAFVAAAVDWHRSARAQPT